MNKKGLWVTTIFVLVMVLALSGPAEAQKKRFFGIGTGGVGGVYYPLGGALAQALTNKIPDMVVTAQTGNASVANVNLISRGEVESGISPNKLSLGGFMGHGVILQRYRTHLCILHCRRPKDARRTGGCPLLDCRRSHLQHHRDRHDQRRILHWFPR